MELLGDEELSVNRDGQKCLLKEVEESWAGQGGKCPPYPPSLVSSSWGISVEKATHLMSSGLQKENRIILETEQILQSLVLH